ncbi:MAG: hypothetical protein E7260_06510 [Lachnospiraceae bacterium]|nr:hypothetical protein [Lachnospiraceae bacterium]
MDQKAYYTMNKDRDGNLSFLMDDYHCHPADSWTDVKEGIVTDIVITETLEKDIYGKAHVLVTGTMVETAEFDLFSPLASKIYNLVVLGDSVILQIDDDPCAWKGDHIAKLTNGDVITVNAKYHRLYPGNQEKRREYLAQVTAYLRKVNRPLKEYDQQLEAFANSYRRKRLDGCTYGCVLDGCILYAVYHGPYRDCCSYYVLEDDNRIRVVGFGDIYTDQIEAQPKIYLSSMQRYLAENHLATGEDSGDPVPGATEEERTLLSTHRLKSGGIVVQFYADTFRKSFLKDKHLLSLIDEDLSSWLYRLDEPNEYNSFFD